METARRINTVPRTKVESALHTYKYRIRSWEGFHLDIDGNEYLCDNLSALWARMATLGAKMRRTSSRPWIMDVYYTEK